MFARSPPACHRNGMKRAASAGRLRPTTLPVVSFFAAAERSVHDQSFVGSAMAAALNALMESVSSASSVGVDDHPDIRTSPESGPSVPLGAAVPPHAATRSERSATAAKNDLRNFI